jgi:Fe-S-cluster containining protein
MSKSLPVYDVAQQPDLPAGEFSSWLGSTRDNLLKQVGATVPCGECNACCRSSQFVHIEPDETRTLARIPKELLFPAPGQPEGTFVLGYDQNGHCPMLNGNKCSIYEDRPRTCRNYDCRVFAATGLRASEDVKELITERTKRWRFNYPEERDRTEYSAVQAATRFMRKHAGDFPGGIPSHSAQIALLAIKVYKVFLRHAELDNEGHEKPVSEIMEAIIDSNQQFEEARNSAIT